MKITNGEIFNTKAPLDKLMAARLPIKTCYQLAKIAKLLSDHIAIIGQMRDKLIIPTERCQRSKQARPGRRLPLQTRLGQSLRRN